MVAARGRVQNCTHKALSARFESALDRKWRGVKELLLVLSSATRNPWTPNGDTMGP